MGRWVATLLGIILAGAVGYFVGHLAPAEKQEQTTQVETRLEDTMAELAKLRDDNRELQQRFDQVTKEQERLAQENEILRKQQTTERLTTEQGGELPARPPK
jgi:uncharacterized membrane-anchored protein YhcB (DUF1043 family)